MKRKIQFTGREVEILQLVADGFTTREIADVLFVNEGIVENYYNGMTRKAGAENISGVVRMASKKGWLNDFPAELKKHYLENRLPGALDGHLAMTTVGELFRAIQGKLPTVKSLIYSMDRVKDTVQIILVLVFNLLLLENVIRIL